MPFVEGINELIKERINWTIRAPIIDIGRYSFLTQLYYILIEEESMNPIQSEVKRKFPLDQL